MILIAYIYKITNKINQKCYIGKTEESDPNQRFKDHIRTSKQKLYDKRPLYSAFNKYGIDNFIFEVIEQTDSPEEREIYYIKFYNSYGNTGYNATFGGDGKRLYNYEDISNDFKIGLLISEIMLKYNCSKEVVENALDLNGLDRRSNRTARDSQAIKQYKGEVFLNEFNSINDAARYLIKESIASVKITTIATNISRVASGKRKTCYGFVWKYS